MYSSRRSYGVRAISNLTVYIGVLGVLGIGDMILCQPSQAQIRNGSFENDPAFLNWMIIGDVSRQETFAGIAPPEGNFQALLTTATTNLRDDLPAAAGTFNFSGNNPANENFASELENFLGLMTNSLNVPVNSPFVATQGSGIRQTFTAKAGDRLQFNWNFLTNDGAAPFFGGSRDYAFVSLYPVSGGAGNIPNVLANSVGSSLTSSAVFARQTGYSTYTSTPLSAGDYVLGLGVVDGAGTDKTSVLLLDSFKILSQETIPIRIIPTQELLIDDNLISEGILTPGEVRAFLADGTSIVTSLPAPLAIQIGTAALPSLLIDIPINAEVVQLIGTFDPANPDRPPVTFNTIVGPTNFGQLGVPEWTYFAPAMSNMGTFQVTNVGLNLPINDNTNSFLNSAPLAIVPSRPSGIPGMDFLELNNGLDDWFVTLTPGSLAGSSSGSEPFSPNGNPRDVPLGQNLPQPPRTVPISIIPTQELLIDGNPISEGILTLGEVRAFLRNGTSILIPFPAPLTIKTGTAAMPSSLIDIPVDAEVVQLIGTFDPANPDGQPVTFNTIVGPTNFGQLGVPEWTYFAPAMSNMGTFQVTNVGLNLPINDNTNSFLNSAPLAIVPSRPSGIPGMDFLELNNGLDDWFVTLTPGSLAGSSSGSEPFSPNGNPRDVPLGQNLPQQDDSTSIPEPSSLLGLFIVGGLGICLRRKR